MVVLQVVSAGHAEFEVQPQCAASVAVAVKQRRLVPQAVLAVQVHAPVVVSAQVLPVEQVLPMSHPWHVPSVPQRYAPQTSVGLLVQLGEQIPTELSVVTLSQTYPERHSPESPGVHWG